MKHLLYLALASLLTLTGACAGKPSVDDAIDDARQAVAAGDFGQAEKACSRVVAMIDGPDSLNVNEQQAGDLAILYMKISEHLNSDDNVAEATHCFLYALRHSPDSLKDFASSVNIDDMRHYELLSRLCTAVDNPVDLTTEEFDHEDPAVVTLLHDELNDNL